MALKLFKVTWDAEDYLIAAEDEAAAALEVASPQDQEETGEKPLLGEVSEETARTTQVSTGDAMTTAWDLYQEVKDESGEPLILAAPLWMC